MADFDKYAPILLRVECSAKTYPATWTTIENLFELCRPGAYSNIAGDKGGPTFAGVTLKTYRQYYGTRMTVQDLKNMAYHEWRTIYKTGYWDRMKADEIQNQSIADLCVDWLVNSGTSKIRNIQKVLGVTADGIVGPKTLAAINGFSCPRCLHTKIKETRRDYYDYLVKYNSEYKKFREGWLNRLEFFNYSE